MEDNLKNNNLEIKLWNGKENENIFIKDGIEFVLGINHTEERTNFILDVFVHLLTLTSSNVGLQTMLTV